MRECRNHGLTEFHRYRAGTAGHRWRCKRCVGEAVTRRHQKIKRTLVEEAGGCCAVCGYDRCIINLHFHHVDPSLKSFHMSVGLGRALDTYREEAKKACSSARIATARSRRGRLPRRRPGLATRAYGPRRTHSRPSAGSAAVR